MKDFYELEADEVEMATEAEECLRLCNPNWIKDRQLTSQLFGDFPKDSGKLSCVQGNKSTAEAAYIDFTERLGLEAHSVWAVTVGEVQGIAKTFHGAIASRVVDDSNMPETDGPRMANHCYIDQRHLSTKERKKLRSKLLEYAKNRGQMYPYDLSTVGDTDVFDTEN